MQESFLRKQITFEAYNEGVITGHDKDGTRLSVALPAEACYAQLPQLLVKGCKLNILSVTTAPDGTLHPRDIIYEPDYLIDISALARCVQPYGSPALGYIINMFEQSGDSAARLLGEAANLFLDDCVNEERERPATYSESMQKFFRDYTLPLSVCDEIDSDFFARARNHFNNIQMKMGSTGIEAADDYRRDRLYLEPSFFCEPLGLQGRIDLLQSDCSHLIELKSGKADEFNGGPKVEHRIQMSLYKEMLCYSLQIPREHIRPYLFYSRYPRFYKQESSIAETSRTLMLRNKIVALLTQMQEDGLRKILTSIAAEDLNERGDCGKLWCNYLRPHIEQTLAPIQNADATLQEYFFGNAAFVAREMYLAKMGNGDYERGRSFADIWNAPLESKIENGNILIDLEIKSFDSEEGISEITLSLPAYSEEFYPNFRAGDTVFLYRRDNDGHNATNRQVTRGTLTTITPEEVTIHLRHKQKNRNLYPTGSRYAMEHDHLDSTFRATFRDLASLLAAPRERIDLLLTRRAPRIDHSLTLKGRYTNEYIDNIVLQAKQAEELFMLVGPPGTGKTSQALKSMVQEFHNYEEQNILLASYTNRAVDEICEALESIPGSPAYIRIGSEQSCAAKHRHRLLKNTIAHCTNREQIRTTMQEHRIFVGTVASLTGRKELFSLKQFDVAIIDEATQILESQLAGLWAATTPKKEVAIKKFILIGDPKQLPAVVAQNSAYTKVTAPILNKIGIHDYGTSLFERLYKWYHTHPLKGITATLNRQGRMHPAINQFANRHFYNSILEPIPLPHQQEELLYPLYDKKDARQTTMATRRAAFINIGPDKSGTPKVNRNEAQEIALFVQAYYKVRETNGNPCNPSQEIGIIVPFRSQIAMVTKEIAKLDIPRSKDIVIDTVERFQGSQREIILFGTTISNAAQIDILSAPVPDADGTPIDRKLNVALTRARRQMFIFGNRDILALSPIYKALIEEV
ncbi:MAG: DNA2/NAM7 family helicase [Bacteroidaceae bacterium]|nr:DNA2/NAM7 family helicase [Bacteroidaceae bacterium]